jgi:hypothetical protein
MRNLQPGRPPRREICNAVTSRFERRESENAPAGALAHALRVPCVGLGQLRHAETANHAN